MASDLEKSTWGPVLSEITWVHLILAVNAIVGLILFEWAWAKTGRFRNPINELNAQFPELARLDAPLWSKWKLYPGAVTLLIPRIFSMLFFGLIMVFCLNVILIGHDSSRPITGCRKALVRGVMFVGTNTVAIFGFFTYLGHGYMTSEHVNNYEEYLGTVEEQKACQSAETQTDSRVPKRGPGPCSTVVCQHIGFMEIMNMAASPLMPGFTPNNGVKKIPIVRGIGDSIQSIYVERGGSQSARDAICQTIINRQEQIEEQNEAFAPICIFAEGTTTNGRKMIPFKRGAFLGMRSITPCFFQISSGQISPTYEIIDLSVQVILLIASVAPRCAKIMILPEFTPNSVMLTKHADKGNEPWEIYSWCIRDIISKNAGIDKLDEKLSFKDKTAFQYLMNYNADRVEINGQMFEYEGSEPVQEVKISSRALIRRKSTITYELLEDDIWYNKDDNLSSISESDMSAQGPVDPIVLL